MRFLYPGRIEIWKCWFSLKEENQRTRRIRANPRWKERTNNKLNPNMIPGQSESNPVHIGGRRELLLGTPSHRNQPIQRIANNEALATGITGKKEWHIWALAQHWYQQWVREKPKAMILCRFTYVCCLSSLHLIVNFNFIAISLAVMPLRKFEGK